MSTDVEINTVEERERRSTGISGLDYQLGGGIPAGTSVVIFGNPLAGTDHMALQFWHSDGNEATYLMYDSYLEDGMIDVRGRSCDELKLLLKGNRVVVDSLSTIILNEGIDAAISLMTDGISEIKERGGNVLFLLYEGIHTPIEEIHIMRTADIFISMREEYHQNEIERKLTVHKIPNMDVPSRIYPYIIRGTGIELSTTARVV
jgi:KaiC/GvpD/RAD55 family RecA-like ATPase